MLISHDIECHNGTPTVAALGFFDGVHLGHRAVIGKARALADAKGVSCGLFTFEPPLHTSRAVSKSEVRLLQSVRHRQEIMENLGVEQLVCPPFESFYDLTPAEFVRVLLHDVMHCVAVVCGEDYHFGCKGSGDVMLLRTLCAEYGIEVDTVPAVLFGGEVVSSTRIRACLAEGKLALAGEMLCEPFRIEAPVSLRQNTLTQMLPSGMMPPAAGRYRSRLLLPQGTPTAMTEVVEEQGTVLFRTTLDASISLQQGQALPLELLMEESAELHKNN